MIDTPQPPRDALVPEDWSDDCGHGTTRGPIGRGQRFARAALAVFIVGAALYTLKNFVPALLWGCVFAIATWPLYHRAELRFGRKDWVPLLFTAVIALIFLIPMGVAILKAAEEAQNMLMWADNVRHNGIPVPTVLNRLPFGRAAVTSWWETNLANQQHLAVTLHSFDATHGMAVTRQVGSQLARRGTLFLFAIVTLFFLLRDGDDLIRRLMVASHRTFGERGESIARQMITSVHGTVAGLVFVGLGEGALMAPVYMFAGTPQPLLFALATAVAAMIPFLALPTVCLAALLALMQGGAVGAVVIIVVGSIIVFVADHFIRPYLIGGSTQMPFLWVLLGILGGVETWGLLGLFLGPAIMAALHLLWRVWSSDAHEHTA
ncbi:AI-2E family transporter [Brytella acorum]|uniref:AI-2E family transporter n=1 Tax=Brytella acorum TaxID=2959299 RepID=A0AA35Y1I6_9PROT|nr:AI-2E family transporter [Brytella acorum]MDF3624156.1 AI-2E family transporter [Brytella acorum]CAI9120662.1 AI-2E family transporter [Brytella acorum]